MHRGQDEGRGFEVATNQRAALSFLGELSQCPFKDPLAGTPSAENRRLG